MKTDTPDDLAKIQVVCALFAESVGDDLYFARQIVDSIDATLGDSPRDPSAFLLAAQELANAWENDDDSCGIDLVRASDTETGFSMLTLRQRLLSAVKSTCRFQRAVVALDGLKEAICPTGRRWSKRRREEYQEAVAFARTFCQQRSRPSSQLALIIFS